MLKYELLIFFTWGGETGLVAPIGITGGTGTLFCCGVMGEVWGDIKFEDILLSWRIATSSRVMVR